MAGDRRGGGACVPVVVRCDIRGARRCLHPYAGPVARTRAPSPRAVPLLCSLLHPVAGLAPAGAADAPVAVAAPPGRYGAYAGPGAAAWPPRFRLGASVRWWTPLRQPT